LARHQRTVTAALGFDLSPSQMKAAGIAVSLHDVPYRSFSPVRQRAYRSAELLTDLLKAADCLDRYRLPRRRWWPGASVGASA
jgi:hypothetical protein